MTPGVDWLDVIKWVFPLKTLIDDPDKIANWIPISLILVIILVAGISMKFFHSARKGVQTWLSEMIRKFDGLSHEDMSARFEDINEEFSREQDYGHHWREFASTLVRRQKSDGTSDIFRTVDARYFFNENSLIEPHLNLRHYNAVPGMLTGMGILGTFIGLSYGLSQLNFQGDITLIQSGVQELLSGAGIAFSTSLWGIGLSILFSVFEKRQVHGLNKEMQRFQEAIDKTIEKRTSDFWLSESLQENIEQTAQLKLFNNDLAYSIAEALDEKLSGRLTASLDSFMEAINELKSYKMESSENTLRELVKEFSNNLSAGTHDEIHRVGQVLTDVAAALENTAAQSTTNQKQLEESFNHHMNHMAETVGNLMDTIGKSQASMSSQAQNNIEGLLEHVQQSLTAQQQHLEGLSSRSQEAMDGQLQAVSQRMSGLLEKVTERAEGVSETLNSRVADLTDRFDSNMRDVTVRYAEERGALSDLIERFTQALKTMDGLASGLTQAGDAMRQSATPVVEATTNLQNILISLRQGQQSFSDTITTSQQRAREQIDQAEETLGHMQASLATTKESWQAYDSNFKGLREDLNNVFSNLNKGLTDYSAIVEDSVNKYLTELDSNLSKSVGLLSGAIEDLSGTVNDIKDVNDVKNRRG